VSAELFEQEILSSATEDWTALWELTSTCSRLAPYLDADTIRQEVRSAVRHLIDQGLVYLCQFRFRVNECDPVPKEEIDRVLNDPASWGPPMGDVHPRVGATDAGMDAYFGSRAAWAPPGQS
jgi:hypothetical protein